MMKLFSGTVLSMLMFAASASGAFDNMANAAPLAPGKPAGVHKAQLEGGNGMLLVAGAALAGITIALATAGNGTSANSTGPGSTSTSTSTTGTSP